MGNGPDTELENRRKSTREQKQRHSRRGNGRKQE